MSYGYNQGGGGGGGYGQPNPYDQRDNYSGNQAGYGGGGAGAGAGAGGYSSNNYNAQGGGYGGNSYENNNQGYGDVEMQPYAQQGGPDPNSILNECQTIDRGIDELERRLAELQRTQRQFVGSDDRSMLARLNSEAEDIMGSYRALGDKVKRVKSKPDSGSPRNAPQVGKVDRRLKKAISDYQKIESNFRRDVQEAQARQYRIVNPEATEDEVREAVEDPNTQIFQQALLNSNRRGQAQSTLSAVRARHEAVQNIERTMIELAQLFQDLDQIVTEQQPMVQNIEQKGEEVHDNVVKANEEIGGAIEKARARNRKKWWCLLIGIIIVIVLALVIGLCVYFLGVRPNQTNNQNPRRLK